MNKVPQGCWYDVSDVFCVRRYLSFACRFCCFFPSFPHPVSPPSADPSAQKIYPLGLCSCCHSDRLQELQGFGLMHPHTHTRRENGVKSDCRGNFFGKNCSLVRSLKSRSCSLFRGEYFGLEMWLNRGQEEMLRETQRRWYSSSCLRIYFVILIYLCYQKYAV